MRVKTGGNSSKAAGVVCRGMPVARKADLQAAAAAEEEPTAAGSSSTFENTLTRGPCTNIAPQT